MPKDTIIYSNTIIYKIYCKDDNVKDIFVGHTTNFRQKKYFHKNACNMISDIPIYRVINENGGWKNWKMEELAKYNCFDMEEAKKKEQYHFNLLEMSQKKWEKKVTPQINVQKPLNISCDQCCFITDNKKDFSRHILTLKHKRMTKGVKMDDYFTQDCECGKKYKFKQGLWKHQQKCKIFQNMTCDNLLPCDNEIKLLTNLVLDVVKQNQELTNKIVDICKTSITTNISNTNINSHNKTFNLQFFLNETCKNAMNITDFVDSLQLQLSDLETVGKLGYVEGLSSIIVKNLNALDETARPIHCTDKKRETFYIKDEDKWEKEDGENNKIRKIIGKVACKNQRLLPKFKELHPDCNYSESKYSDQYSKLVIEAMGGMGNNDSEKENKIIKKIAKEVTITKCVE